MQSTSGKMATPARDRGRRSLGHFPNVLSFVSRTPWQDDFANNRLGFRSIRLLSGSYFRRQTRTKDSESAASKRSELSEHSLHARAAEDVPHLTLHWMEYGQHQSA